MPRPAGAKNLPKNSKDLLEKVITEYKKQGKNLTYNVEDITDLSDEQKALVIAEVEKNPNLDIADIFELTSEEANPDTPASNETDGFQCGNCKQTLTSEVAHCPYCGTKLTWS